MITEVFVKDFPITTWPRIMKFCIIIRYGKLYCVLNNQLYIAYQSLYLYIFLSFSNVMNMEIFVKEQCINTVFILWPYIQHSFPFLWKC